MINLQEYKLSLVYNFHHAFQDLDNFPEIVDKIIPYLSAVNTDGMNKNGPKILTVKQGKPEKDMIKTLMEKGVKAP